MTDTQTPASVPAVREDDVDVERDTGHDDDVRAEQDHVERRDVRAEQDDVEQEDDAEQGGRRNREAGLRHRAQAAEAERDTLRTQLDTLHRQIVGGIATAHGLPEVGLLESAGHELASFITDDGAVKIAEVIEATTATMARYNIAAKRRPAPNLQQGAYGVPATGGGLKDTLNKALGRDNPKG